MTASLSKTHRPKVVPSQTRRKRSRLGKALLSFALPAAMALTSFGCHRQFYRKQADQEVNCLIQEKSGHVARTPNGDLNIQVDQRSRMYNPFDLDFQPMPMDDPASHRYMQCVDGRRGYPMWDAAGFTNTNENPDWVQFLPLNEDGVLVLNNDTAFRLAILHSPDYQEQLERLYLSALDVSSERFLLDTQFFYGTSKNFVANGPRAGGATTAGGSQTLQMRRALATGGTLVANLANSITWQLSGPNTQSAATLLDLSLVQPLLRGAGRDRVLERLTISERRLLANVRSFERYRRSFYLNVTIGRGIESTVQRSGGVFGVGLGGFTGLGGGFAGLQGGGGGNAGFSQGANVPQAGGFLGLLQDQLLIRNQEENIARLSENLLLLENTLVELLTTIPDDPEEIVRQRLQIAQQRSALLSQQTRLVSLQSGYQASVDSFLGTLGLPSYICTRIEDPLLDRFELIDGDLRSRREELLNVRRAVGEINLAILEASELKTDPETGLPVSTIEWTNEVADQIIALRQELEPLKDFLDQLQNEDAPRVLSDIEKFAKEVPKRIAQNDQLIDLYEAERRNICTLLDVDKIDESIFDVSELSILATSLQGTYERLVGRLAEFTATADKIDRSLQSLATSGPNATSSMELAKLIREDVVLATQDLLSEIGDDVLQMQLVQARARTESVLLPEVKLSPSSAFEIAQKNRRDWANARASLVDSWRLIEFNADNLESVLNLTASGGLGGNGNNPFALRSENSTLRLGLEWDAPITRLQERNTYRQSLIEFEQAKRDYYQFEDGIWQLLRGQLRQLQVNRVNFEYGRQAVRIATSQIDLNEDIRALRDSRGLSSGPTAARDTISALSDLRNAQDSLLNVYVNYEVVRRGLDFDLGTMELTPEGMWIDPGTLDPDYLMSLPGTTIEGLPDGQCTDCCIRTRHQPQPPEYGAPMISDPVMMEVQQVSGTTE